MSYRSVVGCLRRPLIHHGGLRYLSVPPPVTPSTEPRREIPAPERKESWLTRKVESSPTARYWFMICTRLLGYGSPKQIAGQRTFVLLQNVCAPAPDIDPSFWKDECDLPPTFQSWFTVTNLHLWLLIVRLRALPEPHGKYYVQFLLDHFFIDVEDRIRAVLQPPTSGPPREPYTFISPFYINPNASDTTPDDKEVRRGQAPERLVTRQMKIFREQYMGMTVSFDHAMVKGDMEMAAAVWRNLLGARGARGIAFPDDSSSTPRYRRSVNLIGGDVDKFEKIKNLEAEEAKDDGSGVHDYTPEEAERYVKYPELMLDIVTYIRRELVRLQGISDEAILQGDLDALKFGKVRTESI